MTPPKPAGYVYDGMDANAVYEWCRRQVGDGYCNYMWRGVRGWHLTVVTPSGHEVLHAGDAVIRTSDTTLGIVRKERS